MSSNTPRFIHFTVKPRPIKDWNFHTVKALCLRAEQLAEQVKNWSAITSQTQIDVITESMAIRELLETIKSGDEMPDIN